MVDVMVERGDAEEEEDVDERSLGPLHRWWENLYIYRGTWNSIYHAEQPWRNIQLVMARGGPHNVLFMYQRFLLRRVADFSGWTDGVILFIARFHNWIVVFDSIIYGWMTVFQVVI